MPLKSLYEGHRVTGNINFKVVFRRVTLIFLCSVLVFTLFMPAETKAWGLFGDSRLQPSVLAAQKVDTTKAQAAADTSASPVKPEKKEDRTKVRELEEKRTTNSSTYVNKDGTKTYEYSVRQKNYRSGNKWEKIDNKLSPIAEGMPDLGLWQNLTNTASGQKPAKEFVGKAGLMKVRMMPLSKGVSMFVGDKTITMKPVGSAHIRPEQKDDRTTIYKNAWKGVDLEYQTEGELVKENIVIKQKDVASEYEFKVTGAKLIDDPKNPGSYTIEGAEDGYRFGGLTLALHDRGPIKIPAQSIKQERTSNNSIKITLDKAWLASLPSSSFPITIDPSFGRWDADPTDWMFKSDGYSCQGNSCWIQAGTLNDNGWKHWRSYIHIPYPELAGGKKVLDANIHAYYNPHANPDPNPRYLFFGHANCISWECRGKHLATVLTAGDFDVNVTGELQLAVNAGDMGVVWSFWGEEVPYKTFKTYSDMSLSVLYDTPTPIATPIEPADKQVTINTQPTLRVNPVGDADGDAVQYYYRVSTSPDGETGAVINSGWTPATQWTVPDGILQDGTTYYWHTYTLGATQTNPNWVRSFKIDLRTGKDSTQAYDTVGPMGIDLATGNATTSTGTHAMNALGGNIGLNFDYNTSTKSKMGLTGEYWNVSSNYPFGSPPNTTPVLTRNDQDINFNWPSGSGPGGGIGTDWFYARWKGYFVAPTTGSYSFGASQDDAVNISVGGQNFSGCPGSAPCYYGAPITLQAGQVVPIVVNYEEATGNGYFRMYVKGAVAEQIVPRDWLRTEVQAAPDQYGLTGRYYTDDGSHNFPANNDDPMRFMMARNDTKLSFNWGTGAPAQGLQTDGFMAKWTGYVTVPTTGTYTFGSRSDDGVRVKLNNGLLGAQQTVLDSWQYVAAPVWGNTVNLTAGQQVPITVEYFEATGPASFSLLVRGPNISDQEIPVKWLTPKASVLPDAWRLGIDVDGNVGYERLRVVGTNIVLEDSTRATHEYTWTGSGYKPPVNEDGQLTRNADNTYTLLDTDGRTYIFNAEGKLKSLTSATDDRQPASLKYEYAGDPSRLMRITDGVTSARYGTLHYKSVNEDGNCSVPGGFDAAPDGMLCAFKTSDGDLTKLYYKAGQLSRIEKPGSELIDYGYDAFGRIASVRDSVANDAIVASVRADNADVFTELSYDELGRVSSIKAPTPTTNTNRSSHTFEYRIGATQMHIAGAPEPHGFSKRVDYDSLLRTSKETDVANISSLQEWDSVKDLQLSSTDATGLKSTTIFDSDDRAIENYGPAPAAWFGANRQPLPAHINAVPKTTTGYDEGLVGPAISYYNMRETTVGTTTTRTLSGAPLLNTTGINPSTPGLYVKGWGSTPPVTKAADAGGWGYRATGKFHVPVTGSYKFSMWHSDGLRMWIDDQLVVDDWAEGAHRPAQLYTAHFEAGKTYRLRIDYYSNDSSAANDFLVGPASTSLSAGAGHNDWSQYLSPGYNLTTSTKAYDAQLGDVETKTVYNNPAYGTVDKTILDANGLNLQTTSSYETPGNGFLRQTSKTMPGGGTVNYHHYSANDTRDNPCTPAAEAYHQAGRPKGKIEADPDGAGPQTGRSSETIYNEAGEMVAARYNDDPWTCTTYDARGRVQQTVIPSIGNKPGRSIVNDYAKDGNPLITATTDSSGTIRVENDLLGRTIKYTDAKGKVTENTYDMHGKLTQRASPLGIEVYEYDQYDRLIKQKLGDTIYATVTYDQYSRIQKVDYPAGLSLSSITRDSLGRENNNTYTINPTAPNPAPSATYPLRQSNDTATIASAGGANHDGTPTNPTTFTLPNLTGSYDTTKTPQFNLPIDAGSTVGNGTQVRLSYDFTGDGNWDKQDTYNYFATDPVAGYEPYTQAAGTKTSSGTFANLQNGTVKVEVWNAIGNGSSTLATSQAAGSTQATLSLPYTMSGGGGGSSPQTLTDQIERYTSGDIKQGIENGVAKSYSYDNAGRLVGATIGSNTFAYEFGAPSASCNGITGNNLNTAKNGNRTKLTVNGAQTTFCYDMADRLISSSDPTLTDVQYDSHGNTVSLGDAAHKTEFGYDASDRNISVKSGDKETFFTRDSQDRIIGREHKSSGSTTSNVNYGFTGSGDSPDFLLDGSGNVTQKYLTLPGDVIVTIKTSGQPADATTYSLPNIHGDIFATLDANGLLKSTHLTGPFGELLPNQTTPGNTVAGTSWNYVGQHQKLTDTEASPISGGIIQMGARVYLPILGRFLSVDPIEGGTDNNYAYANDPVNEYDLDGKALPILVGVLLWSAARAAAPHIARVAVQYVARPAVQFVAKKAAPYLAKKAVAVTKKIVPAVRSGLSKAHSIVMRKGAEIRIGSNLRISLFGNRGAVGKGGIGKNIPARLPHIHFRLPSQPKKVMKLHRPWETIFRKWFK